MGSDPTEHTGGGGGLAYGEEQFRLLIENSLDLITVLGRDLTVSYVGPSVEALLGYEPREVMGRNLLELIHPDDADMARAALDLAFSHPGVTKYAVIRVLHKDGSWRVYEASASNLLDNPVVRGLVINARDVTERKQAEKLMRVQRDLALTLAGTSDVGEMMEASLRAVLDVTGMDSGGIYLVDVETGGLDLAYHYGLSRAFVERCTHYDADSPNTRLVLAGDPLYLNYVELEAYGISPRREEGIRALASIPLKTEGRVMGCINVASHSIDEMTPAQKDAAELLAGMIGQSLERARLGAAVRESELRYRQLHDYAGQGILTYDRELRIVDINRKACEILGYGREELIGKNIFEPGVIHPGDVEQAKQAAEMLLSGLRVGKGEMRFLRKDGSVITGDVVATVLQDEEGEVVAVTNIVSDITAQKAAERALKDSEEMYRVTFESTGTAMILIGLDGTILDANQEVEKLLGYRREEVVGKRKYMEFVHPDDLKAVTTYSRHLLSGEITGPVSYEARTFRGDGKVIDTLIHVSVLPGINKSVASLLDITELKRYERVLEERAEQLRDFLDIAAHELRHPATLLEGYAETMKRYGEEMSREEIKSSLAAVARATGQLTRVVDELLDLSRIERGMLTLSRGRERLLPLVQRAVEEMKARGSDNPMEVDFAPGLDAAWVDADKFLRLMVILLDNAIKYSPPRSPIEIRGEAADGEALLSVLDRGAGVPEEEREKIFERFRQLDKTLHHSHPGLGLGLYIGRRIVEAHGGRIWCEPREGGGSAFRFTLPLRDSDDRGQRTKRIKKL